MKDQEKEIDRIYHQVEKTGVEVSRIASILSFNNHELFKDLPQTKEVKALESAFMYGNKKYMSSVDLLGKLQDISDILTDKVVPEITNLGEK